MKKLIIIILVLLVIPLFAADKNQLINLLEKLKKNSNSYNVGPTAVAGVRGADIQKQEVSNLINSLYWEE